jgi:hypothetical protein
LLLVFLTVFVAGLDQSSCQKKLTVKHGHQNKEKSFEAAGKGKNEPKQLLHYYSSLPILQKKGIKID